MNGGLRPLPASMPWSEKANLMVRRGEARNFSEAARMLRLRRRDYGRTEITNKDKAECQVAHKGRLPYADN